MWFGFGLITLLVGFFFSMHSRTRARWSGQERDLRIHPNHWKYQYQEVKHKGRLQKVRIGVDAPRGFHFTARQEDSRDVFFKRLGVCSEIQLHDEQFDSDVYLESDAKGVGTLLSESKELRDTLVEILRYAHSNDLRGMRVRCAYERLWLEFTPKQESELKSATQELVPLLHRLREGLLNSRLTGRLLDDPFIWRAALMLSISTASAILGCYGLVRALAGRTDILDSWHLFYSSAIVGLVVTGLFVVAVLQLLGRSSRTHLVLIEGVLVGTFGFVLSMFALAREANITFDVQRPQLQALHDIRVEHRITSGRRGRKNHHYYLHTPDWRPEHVGEPLKLEIDRDDYVLLEGKTEAIVFLRAGALGYQWIERVAPTPQPE
jgi:hypothetical protein